MHFKYKRNEFYDDFDSFSNLFDISNNKKISNIIKNGESRTFFTSPEICGLRRAMSEISKNRNNYKIFLKFLMKER